MRLLDFACLLIIVATTVFYVVVAIPLFIDTAMDDWCYDIKQDESDNSVYSGWSD